MSVHTRRSFAVTDRRPCQKPRKDWSMFALGMICFAVSGPVLYAGAVAALELGLLIGSAGFGLSAALWILGMACLAEGRA